MEKENNGSPVSVIATPVCVMCKTDKDLGVFINSSIIENFHICSSCRCIISSDVWIREFLNETGGKWIMNKASIPPPNW